MKIIAAIVLLLSNVAPGDAVGFRDLVERVTPTHKKFGSSSSAAAAAAASAAEGGADADGDDRQLQSSSGNCWSGTTPAKAWHPVYSAGWTNGYCQFTVDCNSPSYSSEASCCKGAYAGQVSGYCFQQLPSPPTTSPTDAGGLDVYYPDYDTAWPESGCINKRPMPSGRPTYSTLLACCKGAYGGQVSGKCLSMLPSPPTTSHSTMVACCKGAYGGQVSGKCLSMLPSPPTTSPTDEGGMADFWYPDYESAWSDAGCSNKLPLPYPNKNDRPNYSSQIACCKGAYGGQVSGKCLSLLASPPTTSPTGVGGLDVWYPDYDTAWTGGLDVYYPDYDTAWTEAGCINDSPLPSGRPTYSTRIACCKGAYGGQVSGKCLSQLDSPPTTSPTGIGGADFYYRDYSKGWSDGTCTNALPLPIQVTPAGTYSTEEECCRAAFGGQVTNACLCSLDVKPTVCYEVKTVTITVTINAPTFGVTIPTPLPTGSALTSLVTSLKNAILTALTAAVNSATNVTIKSIDVTIVSIGGVAVNQRRLGEAVALGGGRSLQSTAVVIKVEVEYSCLPDECAAALTAAKAVVDAAI
eukprot:CAMPEP_0172572722 /NCGR_PEP_ID=MMETSP1067-20121228/135819_1 /TAXON_ID=265564 ORGANISM="Thalassiosira punctigera, Strain Tpunct2005C2" /NCGR_SAMPLE_ID=MMETSP1067 /ASSEMBLY_ACC=CAM_ASM_000444 /LENGTH=578 /DNA_ID=CAMNT_0013365305 /DNA_START=63 /DNA_END=1799 /DNA_ORIENTATION=-